MALDLCLFCFVTLDLVPVLPPEILLMDVAFYLSLRIESLYLIVSAEQMSFVVKKSRSCILCKKKVFIWTSVSGCQAPSRASTTSSNLEMYPSIPPSHGIVVKTNLVNFCNISAASSSILPCPLYSVHKAFQVKCPS